ncbi:MAG TPA: hypothetical protein PK156_29530 [Polyangium sp.]|nr:hypothetical protein [Polyangium sp.]
MSPRDVLVFVEGQKYHFDKRSPPCILLLKKRKEKLADETNRRRGDWRVEPRQDFDNGRFPSYGIGLHELWLRDAGGE